MSISNDHLRIAENLKGLEAVSLNASCHEENDRDIRCEQMLVAFVRETVESCGLSCISSSNVPTLRIAVRHATLPIDENERMAVFVRSDVSLAEQATPARVTKGSVSCITWRHRTDFDMRHRLNAGASPQPIIETMLGDELVAFLDDWKSVNPRLAGTRKDDRNENLKLIEGVGPVFEQRLRASGINTINELANLTDEEISILAPSFTVSDDAGGVIGIAGASRLGGYRKKAQDFLG